MNRNKERKRNPKRRSKKRRKFGGEVSDNNVINKPSEDIMKSQLKSVSDATGIKIFKNKGLVPYLFNKFNDLVFPELTEEREQKLSLKKKFMLWLIRRGGGTRDYIVQSYAHMLYSGNFLERMIASDSM